MQVSLASPSGTAYLNVIAPDGSPLARAQAGAQGFSGSLPVSGDYQLQVMTLGGDPQSADPDPFTQNPILLYFVRIHANPSGTPPERMPRI